ncbi:hypothetical protein PMZ80_007072 [Knufia obscura]|uniref:Uncharacterized protein n=2 Tax=Knufia TaxID=430999 RepID=A0AAN8F865_9EURO|nr:hypothetical protein PMZ80_007072 [Knufia obscura]KAK5953081.1 hypothetical protein OHC33_005649 [Knufia fluminis]
MQSNEIEEPTRFLEIPRELQRNIFTKCYEEPWLICTSAEKDCPEIPRPSTLATNLFYVSKHFHNEAKDAISKSLNNVAYISKGSTSKIPAFARPAITIVETTSLYDVHLKHLKSCLPNLKQVVARDAVIADLLDLSAQVCIMDLRRILEDKRDAWMVKFARRDFWPDLKELERCGEPDIEVLYDIYWPRNFYGHIEEMAWLRGQWLCVRFSISGKGCHVVQKSFKKKISEGEPWTDGMGNEEVLQSLLQQRDGLLLEDMWEGHPGPFQP